MKGILSILLIFLTFYKSSESVLENTVQDDYDDYNEKIYKKYIMIDKQLKSVVEQSMKKLLPYVLEAREHVNVSTTCAQNLFELILGFQKLTNWSVKFLDAMEKIQAGLLAGNLQMFGEYEECIDTIVAKRGKVHFQGQYCNVVVKPFLPKLKKVPHFNGRLEGLINSTRNTSYFMQEFATRAQMFYALDINVWVCVPSGCSKQDVLEIAKYSLKDYLNIDVEHCFKKGDIYFWTTRRIIIVCIFVLIALIVIISTVLDNTSAKWRKKELGFQSKVLQCFSLTRNFPKLMNTDVPEKSVTCLHGIRVLTIFWIILNHEFVLHAMGRTGNHALNFNKMLSSFFSQIVLNGFVNVEMFFFMSGFVNCYSRMLIKKEGRSQPGIGKIIFHRLWRIYPNYIVAFLILFLNKPLPYSYTVIGQHTENCDKYWWRNILFISNFFDPENMCLTHTWFLCADMQLFLVSLFTVPLFLRKPKAATILHVGIILVTNFCSMSWWLLDDGLAPAPLDSSRLNENNRAKPVQIYVLPAVHVGSYFIGILLGYLIATKKDLKIPKIVQLVGWLAASLFFTSMIFMTLKWNSGMPYTQLESTLYGAWSKTILTLGFSWLVLCCATGHARLINYILSLKLWIPLSRITYMIYLISPLVQAYFYTHVNFPEDFSNMRIIWNYFGDILISILASLILVLLAESPLIAMEKILFGRNQEERKSPDAHKELLSSNIKANGFHENSGEVVTVRL